MGKVLSTASSQISRATMRFNAENRAFREMDKQKVKPVAAPKHQASVKEFEKIRKATPDYIENSGKVDEALGSRLKQVYVTSTEKEPIVYDNSQRSNVEKPLPVVRSTEFMEMGYKETVEERIPLGRISFRQALKLIGDHRVNPEEWTAEKVAETYKLKVDVARNVLKHFQSYEVFIPTVKTESKYRTLIKSAPVQGMMGRTTQFPELMEAVKPKSKTEAKSETAQKAS